MMVDPCQDIVEVVEWRRVLLWRPFDDDDLDAERSGGGQFRLGCGAAAVLGDEHVDAFVPHQRGFGVDGERTAGEDQAVRDDGFRRGVDRSDDVSVVRSGGEGRQVQRADRQQHVAGVVTERFGGCGDVGDAGPPVAGLGAPGRAGEDGERYMKFTARGCGVARHLRGEGVGCVDYRVGAVFGQVGLQPWDSAEAADPERDCGLGRASGAAGQRQYGVEVGAAGYLAGQGTCLRRTAEYQKSHFVASTKNLNGW